MDDWQPGDLALCIKMGAWEYVYRGVGSAGIFEPKPGHIYRVAEVLCAGDPGAFRWPAGLVGLVFENDTREAFGATRFRKIPLHTADEEDAETIRLLTGKPITEPA